MADIIATGTSEYATGSIDSATVLVSNVSPISAKHPNGCAAAVVQIETILGSGLSLKGTQADLATRVGIHSNANGTVRLAGFQDLVTDRGLMAFNSSNLQVMNHTPIGIVQPYAGSAAPTNWLLCDGSAVSRTTYTKLFTVTSTTYGVGDGSSTFNVPDLRGRTIIGVDGAANRVTSASTNGANADTLGGAGGEETHLLTIAQMPAHTHSGSNYSSGAGSSATASAGSGSNDRSSAVPTQGGGAVHNNMQPWMALNYIIYAGV